MIGKGGRCLRLAILLLSYVDCPEILHALTSCSPQGLYKPVQFCLASFVTAKEYNSASLMTGVSWQTVSLSTALEFLAHLRIDKRMVLIFYIISTATSRHFDVTGLRDSPITILTEISSHSC